MWVFPKIGGKHPKWMVYFMENPIQMDDLGFFPIIFGNIYISERVHQKFEWERIPTDPVQ